MIALWAMVPGPIRRALAWAVGGIALLWAAWGAGKRDAQQEAALSDAKDDARAHERMNDADLGIGASDAERIDRLREFAAKHGN